LEYQFDWGDGNTYAWGSATQSHSWSISGTYYIKARARCATHTDKVSPWSDPVFITVSYLTLSISVNQTGTGCVFRNLPALHSTIIRHLIPKSSGTLFRSYPALFAGEKLQAPDRKVLEKIN